jgi:hypothetical protein
MWSNCVGLDVPTIKPERGHAWVVFRADSIVAMTGEYQLGRPTKMKTCSD